MLNRFISPSANSGIVTQGVSTATGELITNQLSHLLSQFSDAFDIGVKYENGDATTEDRYGVQISTTILKDRLLLDASAGNTTNNTGASSAIVGDFNVEYKLSKDGRTRVKAFQRSNDYELLDQNSIYTRGVGVSYQKGFNSFFDLFRNKNTVNNVHHTKNS
jgi:hypothetical protein